MKKGSRVFTGIGKKFIGFGRMNPRGLALSKMADFATSLMSPVNLDKIV